MIPLRCQRRPSLNIFLIVTAIVFVFSGIYVLFNVSMMVLPELALSVAAAIELAIGLLLARTVLLTRDQIAAEIFAEHVVVYPFMWGSIRSIQYELIDKLELSKKGRILYIEFKSGRRRSSVVLASFAEPDAFVRTLDRELERFRHQDTRYV